MIGELKTFLQARAGEWNLPQSGAWNFLVYNNYQPNYSTGDILWFHDKSEYPSVVTKISYDPAIAGREFQGLTQAHRASPSCVPTPYHLGQRGNCWTLWMEGVPGLPVAPREAREPEALASMVEVVISIHRSLRSAVSEAGAARYDRLVARPIASTVEFGSSALVRSGCTALQDKVSLDWLSRLPVIPQHGDLFRSHMFRHRGRWRVIDWESFGAIDLPFYDVVTLLVAILAEEELSPDRWERGVIEAVPKLMARYAAEVGLDRTDLQLLFPIGILNWFHLQWADGRKEFAARMYKIIEHYFSNQSLWESVFVPR